MAHTHKHHEPEQRPPLPGRPEEGGLGVPRGPQGDRKHFDKHGGTLEHDGKRAKSGIEGTDKKKRARKPRKSRQEPERSETTEPALSGSSDADEERARQEKPAEREHSDADFEDRDPDPIETPRHREAGR